MLLLVELIILCAIFWILCYLGTGTDNMPLRATSIMPLDVITPIRIPTDATERMVRIEAALEPIAELRKLTASFVTPTKRPMVAKIPISTIITI